MHIELRFFATFREAVGTKTIDREYPDEATVGDVLVTLEDEFEGLAGEMLENGTLKTQVNVLRNGRAIDHLDGLDTDLESEDTLSLFPPVAGG